MALLPLAAAITLAAGAPRFTPAPGGEARLEYMYDLTTTTAKLTLPWPQLAWDPEARELIVGSNRGIQFFNEAGVEVFRYRNASTLAQVTHVIPVPGGDVLLSGVRDQKTVLVRCDFRGRPQQDVLPKGLPEKLANFAFGDVRRAADRLYVLDAKRLRVVSFGFDLAFAGVVDFQDAMAGSAEKPGDLEPRGFWVDERGTIYLGFPFLFHVSVISPDGSIRGFGQKGSTPGKFNVIAGVAADEDGYVYVADILKSVIEVFDPQFRFVGQTSGLVAPGELTYADGRLYVTQGGKAGVAVFKVQRNRPRPQGAESAAPRAGPAASRGRRRPRRRRDRSRR